MTVVIDASIGAKWFLEEGGSAEAESLQLRGDVIAPDIINSEVLHTVWKNIQLKRVVSTQLELAAEALPKCFFAIVPSQAVASRAGQIAIELDHPIYDCFLTRPRRAGKLHFGDGG
jgi:predicted nucleic acid-binding protein